MKVNLRKDTDMTLITGKLNMKEMKLHVIAQEGCVNCPAAKAIIQEAVEGTDITVNIVDLQNMDADFEFALLERQIFIASTPSIILENEGTLKMLYSGTVPSVEEIHECLRVCG